MFFLQDIGFFLELIIHINKVLYFTDYDAMDYKTHHIFKQFFKK